MTGSSGTAPEAPPFRPDSGRQRPPALAPTIGHDRPSGACPHAEPKPVHPRPPSGVRLIGTFALGHGSNLLVHRAPRRLMHHPQRMPELTWSPLVSSSSRSLTGADPAGSCPRFAAVSPTFGRLFEGTDVAGGGQTAPPNSLPSQPSPLCGDAPKSAEKSLPMFSNDWSVHPKPVSFCQCRFHARRHRTSHTQRSEGAWSVTQFIPRARAVRTETNNSHRATTKRDAICPHLWITMWIAVVVSLSTLNRWTGGSRR